MPADAPLGTFLLRNFLKKIYREKLKKFKNRIEVKNDLMEETEKLIDSLKKREKKLKRKEEKFKAEVKSLKKRWIEEMERKCDKYGLEIKRRVTEMEKRFKQVMDAKEERYKAARRDFQNSRKRAILLVKEVKELEETVKNLKEKGRGKIRGKKKIVKKRKRNFDKGVQVEQNVQIEENENIREFGPYQLNLSFGKMMKLHEENKQWEPLINLIKYGLTVKPIDKQKLRAESQKIFSKQNDQKIFFSLISSNIVPSLEKHKYMGVKESQAILSIFVEALLANSNKLVNWAISQIRQKTNTDITKNYWLNFIKKRCEMGFKVKVRELVEQSLVIFERLSFYLCEGNTKNLKEFFEIGKGLEDDEKKLIENAKEIVEENLRDEDWLGDTRFIEKNCEMIQLNIQNN
jgi:hypothetical protein